MTSQWQVAEHGFRMRRPGGEWTLFHDNIDFSWMEPVTDVMKINRMQTPGSVIEVKSSAIVWHYRQARLQPRLLLSPSNSLRLLPTLSDRF